MKKPDSSKRNTVRIIGGTFRSRKLEFPDVAGLRPTADRIRETLFNWVQDQVPGETCLDLFAGSGAIGFEALSRQAAKVVFVEKDRSALNSIAENMQLLEINNAELVQADAQQWIDSVSKPEKKFGLVFLDPPFNKDLLYPVCEKLACSDLLKKKAKIYIESSQDLDENKLPNEWTMLKNKKAGAVRYYLYACA